MTPGKSPLSKQKLVTVSISVVAGLLLASILLLLFLPKRNGTSSSTGNMITGPGSEVIKFADIDSVEGSHFSLDNMFPGDSEDKTYYIEISDSNVKALSFKAEIASETAALSEVLAISIVVDGADNALYNGLVRDMPASLRTEVNGEETEFAISLSLDPRAGNEHQADEINIDFSWWVEDADYAGDATGGGDTTEDKCCPWCFGNCPGCWVIPLLLAPALSIVVATLIAWLIFRRRKLKAAASMGVVLTAKDVGLAALFSAMGIGSSIAIHKLLDRKGKKDR